MTNAHGAASGRRLRFKVVAAQPGGAAAALGSGKALARAATGIRARGDTAHRDISERISRLEAPDHVLVDALYADAHDIRAIAGTFGFAAVGSAADALCRYLDNSKAEHLSDRRLVDVIVAAMRASFANPADPMTDEIAASCHRAVDCQLARTPPFVHSAAMV